MQLQNFPVVTEFSSNVSSLLDFKKIVLFMEEGDRIEPWVVLLKQCLILEQVWDSQVFVVQHGKIIFLIRWLAMISLELRYLLAIVSLIAQRYQKLV